MLLKGHLGIKYQSQYNKVIRLFQYGSANSKWGDWGCIGRDIDTIIVVVLLAYSISSPKGQTTPYPAKVTDQGLCYCNFDAWGWHNRYQSGVISIADQLIVQNGKKAPKCTGGTIMGTKHCAPLVIR